MMLITLVRHGETDWNAAGRIQGHQDIALNATGLAQARALADRLADEPLSEVFCSDLIRTRQTVEPLLALRPLPVTYDLQWRERHFGALQGLSRAQIQAEQPQAWALMGRRDRHADFDGGESLTQFYDRCVDALCRIVKSAEGENPLVVCHGGVLDCIYRFVTGQSLESARVAGLSNAAVNQLRVTSHAGRSTPPAFAIHCWDDTRHLARTRDETDRH